MSAEKTPTATKSARDVLRGKLFASKQFKTKPITLFGAEIEIRQPPLGEILDFKEEDDSKKAVVRSLVRCCYVPGTNERVFEDTDFDAIMKWPFGDELVRVNEAIAELTSIDLQGEEKNLGKAS